MLYEVITYQDVEIDYNLNTLTSENIFDILNGNVTDETPVVLTTKSTDNILMFTSGHGLPSGMVFDGEQHEILDADYWNNVFDSMYDKQNFRQIFWSLEACYSGAIGEETHVITSYSIHYTKLYEKIQLRRSANTYRRSFGRQ